MMEISSEVFSRADVSLSALFGIAVLLGCLRFWSSDLANKKKTWPVVPGSLPFIGNHLGPNGVDDLVQTLDDWIREYGNVPGNNTGLLECSIFGTVFIIACNNQAAVEICKLRPGKIGRASSEIEAVRSVGADGLFSAVGDAWREDRRILAPPLNRKNMKDYLPFVRIVAERLVEKWDIASKEGPVSINRDLQTYPIDVIGLVAFDEDYDCLRSRDSEEAASLRHMFRRLATRALSPVRYWRIPVIGQYLDGQPGALLRKNIRATIQSFESESGQKSGNRSRTYLKKILSQRAMSQNRVLGNLLTMFAAGAETTGNTLMICFWELVQDSTGIMEELVEEVLALEKNKGLSTGATYDDLWCGLPKLRAFFYEVNRLNGTAPSLFFGATEEVVVQGLRWPKGTNFYLPMQYLGTLDDSGVPKGPRGESAAVMCPHRWLVKDKSDPEKWEVIKPSPKNGVSISGGFGTGVRICPGQDIAELEVIFCIANVLKNFEVSLAPDHPNMKLITAFTQGPDIDICLVLKPRSIGGEHATSTF